MSLFKQWHAQLLLCWQERTMREQTMLACLGLLISLFIIWHLWNPLRHAVTTLRYEVAKQEQTVGLLKTIPTNTIMAYLKTSHSGNPVSLVHESLQATGLSEIANPIQISDHQLSISFNEVGFDELVDWLQQLWQQYNLEPSSLVVKPLAKIGAVSATIKFTA